MYLMLSMVSNSLPGTYTCVASTSQGTDTKSGELTVEGIPPKIIVAPTDRVRFGFGLHQGERYSQVQKYLQEVA